MRPQTTRERDEGAGEHEPLLRGNGSADIEDGVDNREVIAFEEHDEGNPRDWKQSTKMVNVAVIAAMAIISPLASSMFTPGIGEIAKGLNTDEQSVVACTTGFVILLGIGPLLLAPLSETFGRRPLYLICLSIFTLLQIPSAISPNIETLVAMRTIAGFFGSIGIANGGGSLSDMFRPEERAGIFGWYLLGPLMGPTLGPLFGGIVVQRLGWRWIFWVLTIISCVNTLAGFFFLRETYAPVILAQRKRQREHDECAPDKYTYEGESQQSIWRTLAGSLTRPLRILIQPIVLTMAVYQAILFGTTYSIYTNMQPIYGDDYGFNTEQVGLLYLGPGLGFLFAVWFIVPRIDTVRNALVRRNGGKASPEFRLPLANIGAVLIPASLFWFAWSVQEHNPWPVSIVSTFFYGIGQVSILNTTTNYYIDSFERYAASAIAAGAVFRSLVGGIIPLFAGNLFDSLGYGWGISVFGFLSLAIAPAPLLFYIFGAKIRERFRIDL